MEAMRRSLVDVAASNASSAQFDGEQGGLLVPDRSATAGNTMESLGVESLTGRDTVGGELGEDSTGEASVVLEAVGFLNESN
jgi:hypothetical protein